MNTFGQELVVFRCVIDYNEDVLTRMLSVLYFALALVTHTLPSLKLDL